MRFPLSKTVLYCLHGLGFAITAQAETIIYEGNSNDLQAPPPWLAGSSVLSPSSNSPSGNTVIVDFVKAAGNTPYNIMGSLSDSSDVTNNKILLQQGTVGSAVYGGYTRTGNATANTVDVTGGDWADVRGGYSSGGTSSRNEVNLNGGSVGAIYTGYSFSGNVENNTTFINSGMVRGNVFGGLSAYGDGLVTGNTVNMFGGTVGGSVYGGRSYYGSSSQNTVVFSGGHINRDIYAGYTSAVINNKAVFNNQLIISGNGTSGGNAYGGYSLGTMYSSGEIATQVRDNLVSVLNSSFGGNIHGGTAVLTHTKDGNLSINVTDNKVILNNSITQGIIYGGYGSGIGKSGDVVVSVTGNEVTITDGTINGDVYGGYGTATISGVGSISVSATNNTVTIDGSPIFGANASLYGGGSNISGADIFSGNSLNVNVLNVSVKDVDNFEFYDFNIPGHAINHSVMLNASGTVNLNDATVTLKSIAPGIVVSSGSQVTLINANILQTNDGTSYSNNTPVYQGVSLMYDVDLMKDGNNRVIATFNQVQVNESGAEPLAEGKLAGFAYTLQGADLAAEQGVKAALASASLGDSPLTGFVAASASSSRYDSGSHVDVDGVSMLAGLAWKQDDLVLAGFFETGKGHYDSYNNFDNGTSVHGDGDINYNGVGILGRYNLTDSIYLDGTARVGQVDTDFKSRDIVSAEGITASYDSEATYYSASVGAGYALKLNDKALLDLSTQYLWTRQGRDSVIVAGDPIDFAAANSHRWRTLGRVYYDVTPRMTFMAGLGYEHEFDGRIKETVYKTYQVDAPNIKGGTGIGELGMSFTPTNNTDFILDIKLRGYTGKREGFAGFAQMKFAF